MTTPTEPFVVVSGPPGSGKSTLAAALAAELGLPLISKDLIKEALLSVLTVSDAEASQELGRASMAVLFRLAKGSGSGAILEANFRRSRSLHELQQLNGIVVEVHCRCSRAVALHRYRSRQGSRHPGHFDAFRSDAELWDPDMVGPLGGGWPVLVVDTEGQLDLPATISAINDLISAS